MADANATAPRTSPAYTATSVAVALVAIFSVFAIAGAQGDLVTKSRPLGDTYADSTFITLAPHLVVLALIAAGLRRTGDALAIPVAILIGAWAALLSLLSPGSAMPLVVLLQVMMCFAAIADLAVGGRAALPAVSMRVRLLGLLATVLIAFSADRIAAAPATRELSRRASLTPQQRAAELGGVLPPSPHLPDSVRLRQTGWADYSALGWLFGTARCIELFRGDTGGPYPRSLGELKAWSLRDTTSSWGCASRLTRSTRDTSLTFLGPEDGRILRYTPPVGAIDPYRPAAFTLETEAVWDTAQHLRGRPGVRNFLLDSAGNVHFTDEHRRVTMRDPVIPPCDPPGTFSEVAGCAVSYPARLRWNAFRLPGASIEMASRVRPGEVFSPMLQYWPVYPIDSVVRVTMDWGDHPSRAPEEVPPVSEQSYGTHHDWNRRIGHVYRAPGSYRLEATFTTLNGDTYKASGTVAVTSSGH